MNNNKIYYNKIYYFNKIKYLHTTEFNKYGLFNSFPFFSKIKTLIIKFNFFILKLIIKKKRITLLCVICYLFIYKFISKY